MNFGLHQRILIKKGLFLGRTWLFRAKNRGFLFFSNGLGLATDSKQMGVIGICPQVSGVIGSKNFKLNFNSNLNLNLKLTKFSKLNLGINGHFSRLFLKLKLILKLKLKFNFFPFVLEPITPPPLKAGVIGSNFRQFFTSNFPTTY